jgi:hypothetical protein
MFLKIEAKDQDDRNKHKMTKIKEKEIKNCKLPITFLNGTNINQSGNNNTQNNIGIQNNSLTTKNEK